MDIQDDLKKPSVSISQPEVMTPIDYISGYQLTTEDELPQD